jgi:hypothetical protein
MFDLETFCIWRCQSFNMVRDDFLPVGPRCCAAVNDYRAAEQASCLSLTLWKFVPLITLFVALVLVLTTTGCVSKSKADAEARAAYIAGQRAAYQSMGGAITDVVVFGNVQKHEVPWVDGLTLSQALATANYLGVHDPQDIILKRNSVETEINPKDLLNGQDMDLKPGDQISVVGQ